MRYEIYIRDRNLERVGVVTKFSKLEMNLKYNDVGGWVLEMPHDETSGAEIMKTVRAQGGGLGGIIVERDGQVIFSGPIQGLEASGSYESGDNSETITFFGTDDTGLLLSRLAMPPHPVTGQYEALGGTGAGYDVFTGKAESAMIHLVKKNCAEDATNPRRINGLVTLTDQQRGSTVTIRSRYHTLIEKLQEAATAGGLGFRVIQAGAKTLEFQVYEPTDKTSSVIFSNELKNLGSYRYKVEAPETNFVIVGGGGETEARIFRYAGDEPSRTLYGTWESFKDQRHTSNTTELDQALYTELEEKTEETELEIQPLDISPTRYLTDYQVGDKATVVVKGERIQDIIRTVNITLTKEDGEQIVPTIGTPGVGTTFRLFDPYRNLEARIGNLEKI